MPVSGITVVRRQLGRRLRQLREQAGKTFADVEAAHLGSHAKVWRIERGMVAVKVPTVRTLCEFYGVDQAERQKLEALALGTGERGWWQDHRGAIPEWLRLYVDLEAAATEIRTWEDSVVPGELQTADYARAVFQAAPGAAAGAVEQQIRVRLARQEQLLARAPRLLVVLGENVVARQVGGQAVMDAQVEHLRELDGRDHISIRVLPFSTGAHAGMTGAFRILDFEGAEDPDVVYVEAQVGARYLERPSELDEYRAIWEQINAPSVPIGDYR